ncbi:hypothetical protein FC99_GL000230 [Levilactobacillus koreensis JCM 16448]|uniref:Uncharacterized protein n=1 Tax=Levilactobacillus koreensis TaxID=637971 RepID=A0AAC8ZGJ6_9LACO|nr:hypothetical protein [Levilactobacillus koreensis]AKP64482.1 hypothetical protein ABN16_05365 [Levilactobacillus koreensis]KRK89753.1 hypothetical protein FC99_GL000230 [Levilactobacillus koreensis JCM 16448]
MNKIKASILIASVTLGLSLITPMSNQSAQAAARHKGMPAALRGNWSHPIKKFPKYWSEKGPGSIRLKITKDSFYNMYYSKKGELIDPYFFFAHPRYTKIGKHTYRFLGGHGVSGKSSGFGHNDHLQIVKQGNKIKYKYTWSPKVKYSAWFYKK